MTGIYLRRLRRHGHTVMTRPRLRTRDVAKVDRSLFFYADDGDMWGPDYEGWYSTSLLGMVNGIVGFSGWRFVLDVTKADENGGRYILRGGLRRWRGS